MRVAILTGASSGMGFAVARRLGQEGYTLIVNSRDPSQAVKRLEAEGWKVIGVPGDLAEASTAEAWWGRRSGWAVWTPSF